MSLAMVNAPARHRMSVTNGHGIDDGNSLTGEEESGPTDEAMMAFKDADKLSAILRYDIDSADVLVVSVSHPRDCSTCSEEYGNVCEKTECDNRDVLDAAVLEDHDDFQDEPCNTGGGTARVNATKMLYLPSV